MTRLEKEITRKKPRACFFSHKAVNKLVAANKCLYILRTPRKQWYCQAELDKLFSTLDLPKLMYGISVLGSFPPERTTIQIFLDRYHKRRYTSSPVSIINCLQKSDKDIFNKLSEWKCHPLYQSLLGLTPPPLSLDKSSLHFRFVILSILKILSLTDLVLIVI